ncbi:DegT/DnrJ/EryC1/StrS family aminotransferase [Paenibacillus sp. S3N08]|uniref:DegT/DnrJ/EryC1/StrS family aminotransferase n=2 Tax=Paenibacillus agricola TaxID=2716264 RepID=A0ABX0IZJ2_9BACL|nr:DegT/DnrJ/EryC1/StrS family aminotransferase [Paenibacillus agricola]
MTIHGLNDYTKREVPLLDTVAQYTSLKEELQQAMNHVLESGSYIMGPSVKQFEEETAKYCGVKHAIGVANGTDALLLTLDALGIGPGDEVITSPFTFFASAEVISQVGAVPVFIDIEADTYNINIALLEAAITPRTKAVIPVHIFGQPVQMDELMELARKYELYVIEDACQAMGSAYRHRPIGSIGTAGCFSFFPTKNLGGYGDGGMVITNDDELAAKLRILRVHGSNPKYYHSMIGYNSRLDSLQAAMLKVKLPHLDEWNRKRRQKALVYTAELRRTPLKLPIESKGMYVIYHLYIIHTEHRDALLQHLAAHGIGSGSYYPVPLHRQQVYEPLGYGAGSLPVAEHAALGTMALPLYPEMSEEDQAYVIAVIHDFFEKRGELL